VRLSLKVKETSLEGIFVPALYVCEPAVSEVPVAVAGAEPVEIVNVTVCVTPLTEASTVLLALSGV